MKKQQSFRHFELGLIAALAFALAAFEWTGYEFNQNHHREYLGSTLIEPEIIPHHIPSKPLPPKRIFDVSPEIVPEPDPIDPIPNPDVKPQKDPLAGKLKGFDFTDFGAWEEEWEIETVLIAEHMPHFEDCTNVLDRKEERRCTEEEMIRIIQSCAKFPPILRETGIGGVVFLQFNVNEFGEIQDETVLKSAHPKLDQAALNALSCIPKMRPGTQQGKPVRVTYTIPVRFTIR